jgi:hypothetical protein
MPLSILGKGRMGLAEKTQAHVHQTWLEYGPAIESARSASQDVRVCLSDMGTELGVGDTLDVASQCLRNLCKEDQRGQPGQQRGASPDDAAPHDQPSMLYPNAMVVPGPQHMIDGVVSQGAMSLPWWEEWKDVAKVTSQWLTQVGNRRWLKTLVEKR